MRPLHKQEKGKRKTTQQYTEKWQEMNTALLYDKNE